PPGPLIVPDRVALLPAVSKMPPWLISVIGSALAILAPANCRVPPVKIGPGALPDAEVSVHASAPDVLALKVSPLASSALPLPQTPRSEVGRLPTVTVAMTVLVAVSMTETKLTLWLLT